MLKNHEVTTRAVVISRAPQGEGSVRVFLYTHHLGLVAALAKSAREERSKLRPHLQVGTFGTYTLVKGGYDWKVIGATDTTSHYFSLSGNEVAQRASSRVITLVHQLVHGEEVNEDLFDALWEFLSALPELSEEEVKIAERLAVVRVLRSLGYVPSHKHIPHLEDMRYDGEALKDVAPHKRAILSLISDALSASGLL